MNVLGALLKRLSFRRAPHVWLAVIGIICHLGISIFAPMFQPDEGDIKRLVYSFRIIVVAVYILADLCVLAYKWQKVRNINLLLHSGQPYVIESQSSMRKDALGNRNFPYVVRFFLRIFVTTSSGTKPSFISYPLLFSLLPRTTCSKASSVSCNSTYLISHPPTGPALQLAFSSIWDSFF